MKNMPQEMKNTRNGLLGLYDQIRGIKQVIVLRDARSVKIQMKDDTLFIDYRSMRFAKTVTSILGGMGIKTLVEMTIGKMPVIGQLFLVCSVIVGIAATEYGDPIDEKDTVDFPDPTDVGIKSYITSGLIDMTVTYSINRTLTNWARKVKSIHNS